MAPQPRAQTSPPKPWEHHQRGGSTPHVSAGLNGEEGQCARPLSSQGQLATSSAYPPQWGTGSAANSQQLQQRGVARGSGAASGAGGPGAHVDSRRRASMGSTVSGLGTRRGGSQGGGASPAAAREQSNGTREQSSNGTLGKLETRGTGVGAKVGTGAVVGAGEAAVSNGNAAVPTVQIQQSQQLQRQQGMYGAGTYGGVNGGYISAGGYGAGRYGGTTSYGGGYGGISGTAYGGGGYGGYGGYSGYPSMHSGGYGMYGGRPGMGGGMGMAGMGGLEQQFTWLHSIQQFTSSLGYLTEMLGMNTQAIGFIFGNLMGFLEHIGNTLTSIQPWREFPPGHPRHGEPPPTPEEERKRLSRMRVLRFALTLVVAYAVFRLFRTLHRFIAGRQGRPSAALTYASLESIYRQQRGRVGASNGVRPSAEALAWEGAGSRLSGRSPPVDDGARASTGGALGGAFDGIDPWNEN